MPVPQMRHAPYTPYLNKHITPRTHTIRDTHSQKFWDTLPPTGFSIPKRWVHALFFAQPFQKCVFEACVVGSAFRAFNDIRPRFRYFFFFVVKRYWDRRFEAEETFDWFCGSDEIVTAMRRHCTTADRIMVRSWRPAARMPHGNIHPN